MKHHNFKPKRSSATNRHLNATGKKIKLHINDFMSGWAKEFEIEQEGFSFSKWKKYFVSLTPTAFCCQLHYWHTSSLVVLLLILSIILATKVHLQVKKESLLVITSLGMQLTTTFVTGRQNSQFIEKHKIKDVVINEGITMHQVLYYLAVLLQSETSVEVLPLFQNSFPRCDCLQKIYEEIQLTLFENS